MRPAAARGRRRSARRSRPARRATSGRRPCRSRRRAQSSGSRRPTAHRPRARARRSLPQLGHRQRRARRPDHVRDGDQSRPRPDRGQDRLGLRRHDDDARTRRVQRPDQAEVLRVGRDDLVPRLEAEAREHDVAAVRGRARQRHQRGLDADELRDAGANHSRWLSVRLKVAWSPRPSCSARSSSWRIASTAGLASGPFEPVFRYATARAPGTAPSPPRTSSDPSSTGAWSESTRPSTTRRSPARQERVAAAPRTSTWSIPPPSSDQPGKGSS